MTEEPIGEDSSQASGLGKEKEEAEHWLRNSLQAKLGAENAKLRTENAKLKKQQSDEQQKRRAAEVSLAAIEERKKKRTSGDVKLTNEQAGFVRKRKILEDRLKDAANAKKLQKELDAANKLIPKLRHAASTMEDTARKGLRDSRQLSAMNLERDKAISLSKAAMTFREKADAARNRWKYTALILAFPLITVITSLITSPAPDTPEVDVQTEAAKVAAAEAATAEAKEATSKAKAETKEARAKIAALLAASAPKVEVHFEGDILVVKTNFKGDEKILSKQVFVFWYGNSHTSDQDFEAFHQQVMITPDGSPRVLVSATRKSGGMHVAEVRFVHTFRQNE